MKALSILGTSSSAGKSWMTTAFCAWLHGQGVRVAPFKAQNMSNNAWATLEGKEMARAQAVQAEACGLRPESDMNPILLKPSGGSGAQLVLRGVAMGHFAELDYYRDLERLWEVVRDALDGWRSRCDVLVMEGAGSPVELNLMNRDLVNLRPIQHLDGKWVLVGDIDRGGIFAQLAGTWNLLPEADRARGLGAIVNRFRGDLRLFPDPEFYLQPHAPGLKILGTLPFRADLQPEEEDGFTAADADRGDGDLVAWIRFPHAANLTDCQPWWDDQGVRTKWVSTPAEIEQARVVVLPGSKNTIADLRWMKRARLDTAIVRAAQRGALVMGLCGGFQMLGQDLEDAQGVAGEAGYERGLDLLPVRTVFDREKMVRQVTMRSGARQWNAYEIHMGRSTPTSSVSALQTVWLDGEEKSEGMKRGVVWGTYLHGWFEAPEHRRLVAAAARLTSHHADDTPWSDRRLKTYRAMAQHLAAHVDLEPVRRYLGL